MNTESDDINTNTPTTTQGVFGISSILSYAYANLITTITIKVRIKREIASFDVTNIITPYIFRCVMRNYLGQCKVLRL